MDEDRGGLFQKLLLVADLVEGDPVTILCYKDPRGEPGLECQAINEQARTAGLIGPREFIIEPREEPSTEPGVQRPSHWITFHHPDRNLPPIDVLVRDSYSVHNELVPGYSKRIAAFLRAWAETCNGPVGGASGPKHATAEASGAHRPGPLPSAVAGFATMLGDLLDTAIELRGNVTRLERACAAGELSEAVRRGWFPEKGSLLQQEEADRLRGEPCADEAISAIRLTRKLRGLIPEVLNRLPAVSPWVDDRTKPAQDRWTAVVAVDLRALNGCPHRGQPRDARPSDLPWPDQAIGDTMGELLERLERRWNELQAIERTRAEPIIVPHELAGNSGDLHPEDAAALLTLAGREYWGTDELPPSVTAETLLCLDRAGFVEARHVVMQNVKKFPGDPTPPVPTRGRWFSPLRHPGMAGPWKTILTKTKRGLWDHPYEVQVSQLGRDEVREIRRRTAAAGGGGTPESQSPHGVVQPNAEAPRAPVAPPTVGKPEAPLEYRAASWFTPGASDWLRKAAAPTRKSKRVRSRIDDDTKVYCVEDVRKWRPDLLPGS